MDSLINNGAFMTKKPDGTERTVVVFGIPRSGTTMVSKMLTQIGINMGNVDSPVGEDIELASLIEKNQGRQKIEQYITKRNSQDSIWGWKRPEAFKYRNRFLPLLRNPVCIILFRDPLAIALREQISMKSDIWSKMKHSLKRYEAIVNFAETAEIPCLLISYEKALMNPEYLSEQLAAFTGIAIDAETKKKVIKQVKINDVNYLRATKRKKQGLNGIITAVNENYAEGWAHYKRGKRVPKIICYLGNDKIGTSELISSDSSSNENPSRHYLKINFSRSLSDEEIKSLIFREERWSITVKVKSKLLD